MDEIIRAFILPSNLIIICVICGFVLLFVKKVKRIATFLFTTGAILYIIFATGPISFLLLGQLEYQYPPLTSFEGLKEVETIVVLPGYAEKDPNLPLSSKINPASAFRIIEALRLSQVLSDSKIVISGQGYVTKEMRRLMIALGAQPNRAMIGNHSTGTYESAVEIQKILSNKRFILVTSAGHMPRAMGVFQRLGMNPIPAPTHYMSKKNYLAISYLPSPTHLIYSDLAVGEYLGILWYRITGRL